MLRPPIPRQLPSEVQGLSISAIYRSRVASGFGPPVCACVRSVSTVSSSTDRINNAIVVPQREDPVVRRWKQKSRLKGLWITSSKPAQSSQHRSIHSSPVAWAQPLQNFDEGDYGEAEYDVNRLSFFDPFEAQSETGIHRGPHPPATPTSGPSSTATARLQDTEDEASVVWMDRAVENDMLPEEESEMWEETPDSLDHDHGPVPAVQEYEEPSTKRPRRKRRKEVVALPPLPAGELPEDGTSRFDWRSRSFSRMGRATRGNKWYPQVTADVRRDKPSQTKLEPEQPFYDEVKSYSEQFKPLLEAEFAEEERLHRLRRQVWPEERLMKEGYMLLDMTGSRFHVKSREVGFVYQFSKGTQVLPSHKFTVGSSVDLSRTHPETDGICTDGKILPESEDKRPLSGTVYSFGKGFIRVAFSSEVLDIDKGHWRLDLGCNDFAMKRQLKAIESLNLDPRQQDIVKPLPKQAFPKTEMSEEDEAFAEAFATYRKMSETKLQGTNLRDLLLHAYQGDIEVQEESFPSAASTSMVKPVITEFKPDTVDATPTPSLPPTPASNSILSRNQLIQSWTKRYRTKEGETPLVMEGDPNVPLNPTQLRAVGMMLSERLSLVQGPPGTGKTRVIIETIKLLKEHWQIPQPILVTAHTNTAVDNLLAGLRTHGLKAIKYGAAERVRDDLKDYSWMSACEEHPNWRSLEELSVKRENMDRESKKDACPNKAYLVRELIELGQKTRRIRLEMYRDVLLDADVICATCLSSVAFPLEQIDFPIVFLDEASMATEPLSLVPLMKGSSHVAIIGDHKQLPPVIISPEAHAGGLSTSMFERLIHEHHIPSIMLDTQYRMHPSIAEFPSTAFYRGDLKNGTVDSFGKPWGRFAPPVTAFLLDDESGNRMNMTFVNEEHSESPLHQSVANYGEAQRVCDIVADLLFNNPDLTGNDIGIITPYRAQIGLIDDNLLRHEANAKALLNLLGMNRYKEIENIEVKTVDGFEGREKQVIIFSTVRSNDRGYIGFLADWRRLNVGITRAQRALIMVGSVRTLENAMVGKYARETLPSGGAKIWRDFIRHLKDNHMILDG